MEDIPHGSAILDSAIVVDGATLDSVILDRPHTGLWGVVNAEGGLGAIIHARRKAGITAPSKLEVPSIVNRRIIIPNEAMNVQRRILGALENRLR